MTDFDCTIICSCLPERIPLLERSVETWVADAKDSRLRVAICINVEGFDIINMRAPVLPMYDYYFLTCFTDLSGSHISGYNYSLKEFLDPDAFHSSRTFIMTHPEMLFPQGTINTAHMNALRKDAFVAFKCFWLSPDMTRDLDQFDWKHPETLEDQPMLFELDELLKGSFYANATARNIRTWEATTTYAMSADTMRKIYPLEDFGCQGPDDPWHHAMRQRLEIKNITIQEPMLFHQFHRNSWTGTGEEAVELALKAIDRRFSNAQ